MRLTKLRRHIRSPAEKERRLSVGKLLYFLVLAGVLAWGVRYGVGRAMYFQGRGFVRGESVAVQALNRARISEILPGVNDRVEQGAVVARLSAERTVAPRPQLNGAGRLAELKAEEHRLRARLQDERDAEIDAVRKRLRALEADLWSTREKLRLREARAQGEDAMRQAREGSAEHWRRLYELEAITLPEYLRRVEALGTDPSGTAVELATLRSRERRLQNAIDTATRELDKPRGRRETRARLGAVREEARNLAAAPSTPAPAAVAAEGVLRAPRAGVMATLLKQPGEVLLPGDILGEIVDPDQLYVEAYFAADLQQHLYSGLQVELVFPSGTKGRGQVVEIDPVVTPLAAEYQKRYESPQKELRVKIELNEPRSYLHALDVKVQVLANRFNLR